MQPLTETLPVAAIARAPLEPLCVLCLELDGIKALTWARDPSTGEDLLTTLTARLAQALGDDGTLTSLTGGTFAVLLPGLPDRERLCHLAWKLLDTAATPVNLGNIRFALRPWVGIARWPTDGTPCAGLFRNARSAMHRARHQKSGYAFFDESADIWEHDD